ncbi:831698be-70e1-464d-8be3-253370ffbe89 [Sclerotinia trifoliorum]|uniref:831698be-70e1-464d-8be3-253370ffbe89 n=1 Tax=Sclerotinia trifoliorum TaxID=28548 RepID=A0A8H2VXS5_9HELO|nr:831698be-70e1-464d-8be3-253370ffbe89 [Sclerotinia trifoliorum]
MAAVTPARKQLVPDEIFLRIIELRVEASDEKANRPTIVCLGLTARICWKFLQTQYQMQMKSATSSCFPTSLDEPFLDQRAMRQLITMLTTWVGPDYRRVPELFINETSGCQIMFLRREVYGDKFDGDRIHVEEGALINRLRFWKRFPIAEWHSLVPFRSPILKTLSYPYGMGREWYPTAAREFKNIVMCYWKDFMDRDYHSWATWNEEQNMFWMGIAAVACGCG